MSHLAPREKRKNTDSQRKKGLYFSFDAVIALSLMFLGLFTVTQLQISSQPLQTETSSYRRAARTGQDAMQLVGQQRLSSLSDNWTQRLFNQTAMTEEDVKKSVLDTITLLWSLKNYSLARNFSKFYLNYLIPDNYQYRVKIGGEEPRIIYSSSNLTNPTFLTSARRLVSGYKRDMPPSGYVSKASLQQAIKVDSEYFYFGGYVGDGLITRNFTLPDYSSILNFSLELDAGSNFSLAINGQPAGTIKSRAKT